MSQSSSPGMEQLGQKGVCVLWESKTPRNEHCHGAALPFGKDFGFWAALVLQISFFDIASGSHLNGGEGREGLWIKPSWKNKVFCCVFAARE